MSSIDVHHIGLHSWMIFNSIDQWLFKIITKPQSHAKITCTDNQKTTSSRFHCRKRPTKTRMQLLRNMSSRSQNCPTNWVDILAKFVVFFILVAEWRIRWIAVPRLWIHCEEFFKVRRILHCSLSKNSWSHIQWKQSEQERRNPVHCPIFNGHVESPKFLICFSNFSWLQLDFVWDPL